MKSSIAAAPKELLDLVQILIPTGYVGAGQDGRHDALRIQNARHFGHEHLQDQAAGDVGLCADLG